MKMDSYPSTGLIATVVVALLTAASASHSAPRSIRQDGVPMVGTGCVNALMSTASDSYSGYDFIGFASGGLTGTATCKDSGWVYDDLRHDQLDGYFSDISPGFSYDNLVDYYPFRTEFATESGTTLTWTFWQQRFVTLDPWYGFSPEGLMVVQLGGTVFGANSPIQLDGSTTYVSRNGVQVWNAGDYHGEYLCFGSETAGGSWGFLGILDGNFDQGQNACHATTEVPLPGTLGLLSLGLAGLGLTRRRLR